MISVRREFVDFLRTSPCNRGGRRNQLSSLRFRRILDYSGESLNDLRRRLLIKPRRFASSFVWRRLESLMSAAMVLSIRRSSPRSLPIMWLVNNRRLLLLDRFFLLAPGGPFICCSQLS